MFEQALLAAPRSTSRSATFVASMSAQVLFLGTALIVPMFLIQGPSVARLNSMLLAPPAPLPPPPVSIQQTPAPKFAASYDGVHLRAPVKIPDHVANIVEQQLPADPGLDLGVVGGVRSGAPGGVIGSMLNEINRNIAPPPKEAPKVEKTAAAEKPVTRIRTSSGVQSAKLIHRVIPAYPPLAKAARISGTVKLMGVLSKDGRIAQLQVLSGHPLLVNAALEAVRQWRYEPTLLSGEPVEVVAPIDVNFTLSQ